MRRDSTAPSDSAATAYKRVLVVYDGTPASRRALASAIDWARRGAELFVVTIALARLVPEDVDSKAVSDLSEARRRSMLKQAEAAVASAGLRGHFDLLRGDRREQIRRAAERYNVDAIVLGEAKALGRLLFGSPGVKIRELTGRPVIAVP